MWSNKIFYAFLYKIIHFQLLFQTNKIVNWSESWYGIVHFQSQHVVVYFIFRFDILYWQTYLFFLLCLTEKKTYKKTTFKDFLEKFLGKILHWEISGMNTVQWQGFGREISHNQFRGISHNPFRGIFLWHIPTNFLWPIQRNFS